MKMEHKVIIAGAGPGDAELITVKLQKALGIAEVIIVDRLVNPAIIHENAKGDAEIIFVGKQGYNDASLTQDEVSKVLLHHAGSGKKVLRLKGGDIAFYSNVLDELKILQENNIPFEIIPGITAASGASAYAGIPLTARGYSQSVQFHTYNPNSFYSTEKWKCLAASTDTLVFYMAARNITDLAELMMRFSKKPLTPLAVIEQATTVHQQVHTTTLRDCASDFAAKTFSSPSLVIIGDVVNLHKEFHWLASGGQGSIFNELVTGKQ
jgi:uroporphyrin-III C-methyltransferase